MTNECHFGKKRRKLNDGSSAEHVTDTLEALNRLQEETDQFEALKRKYPKQVKKHVTMFECEWERLQKEDYKVRQFMKYQHVPFVGTTPYRLSIRGCTIGAFNEVFLLKWNAQDHPDSEMLFQDVVSMYAWALHSQVYPTQKPIVLVGPSAREKVEFTQTGKFLHKSYPDKTDWLGFALCSVLPPKHLKFPFALYRDGQNRPVGVLCKACFQKCQTEFCSHNDSDRMFLYQATLCEFEYLAKLNYKIVDLYEIWMYPNSAKPFEKIIKRLTYHKIRHSKFTSQNESIKKQLQQINKDMQFSGELQLTEQCLEYNPAKRKLIKGLANSFFGKTISRSDHPDLIICETDAEIARVFKNREVTSVTTIYENYVQF